MATKKKRRRKAARKVSTAAKSSYRRSRRPRRQRSRKQLRRIRTPRYCIRASVGRGRFYYWNGRAFDSAAGSATTFSKAAVTSKMRQLVKRLPAKILSIEAVRKP